MRLLTLRTKNGTETGTVAVRQDGETLTEIDGFADVGALLKDSAWEAKAKAANGTTHALDGADLAPVVPSWAEWSLQAESEFDLFRFSDAPIFERLNFNRTYIEGRTK